MTQGSAPLSTDSVGTTTQERLAQLRQRAEADYPQSWVPTESDRAIVGEFAYLSHGRTAYGDQDIVVLRTEDGTERSVWLLHDVLRRQVARAAPKPGDLVCILWKGKRRSAGGNDYDDYRVEVDPGGTGPNWGGIATGESLAEQLERDTRVGEHLPEAAPQQQLGGRA